jgi:hypothetical protein
MLERGINEKEVEMTLSNPDFVEESLNKTLIASKKIGERIVKIIYSLQDNKIIIITVF